MYYFLKNNLKKGKEKILKRYSVWLQPLEDGEGFEREES
jgi:hypothetical protein